MRACTRTTWLPARPAHASVPGRDSARCRALHGRAPPHCPVLPRTAPQAATASMAEEAVAAREKAASELVEALQRASEAESSNTALQAQNNQMMSLLADLQVRGGARVCVWWR